MEKTAAFRTSDIWLAAGVMATTHATEVDVEHTTGNRRAVFVIAGVADAERIADEFHAERLQVNAHGLMRAIRRLKRALYDGE